MKLMQLILVIVMASVIGFGFANEALSFDGNDCVGIPNPGPTNMVTAECWFNLNALGGGQYGTTILSASPGTIKSLWLTSFGTELNLRAFIDSNNSRVFSTSGANIQTGVWYHVAVVAQRAGTTKLYLNGVEMINQPSYNLSNFGTTFYMGNLRTGAAFGMNGYIDEVRLWNTLRTEQEINDYMNALIPTPYPAGLLGYWPLDTADGSTIEDMTDPAQDGTVYNGNVVNSNPTFVTSDVTLPVELTAFMATGTADFFIRLTWITQSETDVLGYYIYRNSTQQFADAIKISELIPAQNNTATSQYSYVDQEVTTGSWYYWLQSVDYNGTETLYNPVLYTLQQLPPSAPPIIESTILKAVYPNPFNPSTLIAYTIAEPTNVVLSIYNSRGQKLTTLRDRIDEPGDYQVSWDGRDENGNPCASGIYLVRMQAGSRTFMKKAMMVK